MPSPDSGGPLPVEGGRKEQEIANDGQSVEDETLGKSTEEQMKARTMPTRITPQSICSANHELTFALITCISKFFRMKYLTQFRKRKPLF